MIGIAISSIAMTRAHSKRPPVVNDDSGGLLCLLEAPMFEMGAALEQDARYHKGPCPAVQYRPRISWCNQGLAQDKRTIELGPTRRGWMCYRALGVFPATSDVRMKCGVHQWEPSGTIKG